MNDASGMSGIESVCDLNAQRQDSLGLHRLTSDAVLQGESVQKLHSDERLPALLVNFVNRADVRMVQCGSRLCLALEAGKSLCVLGNVVRQELEGNEAMQLHVVRLVNHTHPSSAESFNDAIVGDGLVDHRWRRRWTGAPM